MKKDEMADAEYTITDDGYEPESVHKDYLIEEIRCGLLRLTDVLDEEYLDLRRRYASDIVPQRAKLDDSLVSAYRNILTRLEAVRFEGIPTLKQLREYYSRDQASFLIVAKRGIDTLLENIAEGGTVSEAAFMLKSRSMLDDSELCMISNLSEYCQMIDRGKMPQSLSTPIISRYNRLFQKIVPLAYSFDEEDCL